MEDDDAIGGGLYEGGDENRWGEVVAARDGDSAGNGVAGSRDDVYLNSPVLCGFVDMGGGIEIFFEGSLLALANGFVSMVSL